MRELSLEDLNDPHKTTTCSITHHTVNNKQISWHLSDKSETVSVKSSSSFKTSEIEKPPEKVK